MAARKGATTTKAGAAKAAPVVEPKNTMPEPVPTPVPEPVAPPEAVETPEPVVEAVAPDSLESAAPEETAPTEAEQDAPPAEDPVEQDATENSAADVETEEQEEASTPAETLVVTQPEVTEQPQEPVDAIAFPVLVKVVSHCFVPVQVPAFYLSLAAYEESQEILIKSQSDFDKLNNDLRAIASVNGLEASVYEVKV